MDTTVTGSLSYDDHHYTLLLGSKSQFRHKVMDQVGVQFESCAAGIDESKISKSDPKDLVLALSEAKSMKIRNVDLPKLLKKPYLLITCDQVVSFKNEIRGKPHTEEVMREYLSSYSNSHVELVSGIMVYNTENKKSASGVDVVSVHFKEIPEENIQRLIDSKMLQYSCGGITLEHEALYDCVTSIDGPNDSVFGLPLKVIQKCIDEVTK